MKKNKVFKGILLIFCMTVITSWVYATENVHTKRVLLVIAPEQFYTDELFAPIQELGEAGIAFDIVSTTIGAINGMYFDNELVKTKQEEGFVIVKNAIYSKKTFSEIKPEQYDAISVTGGIGTIKYLWENKELRNLIVEFGKQKKIIAAICAGPVVLARAGVLKGVKATCPYDDLENGGTIGSMLSEELKKNKAEFINADVMVDEKIITANGPMASIKYGKAIVAMIKNMEKKRN